MVNIQLEISQICLKPKQANYFGFLTKQKDSLYPDQKPQMSA